MVPRHPEGVKDKMIAGYRPRYKEGFRRMSSANRAPNENKSAL